MEPDININHLEISARGEKQEKFDDLFAELQRLPHGEDQVERKEQIYEDLLTMLVKRDFFPPDQYDSLIRQVEDEFRLSMMTEEETALAREQQERELDERYRSPGFRE